MKTSYVGASITDICLHRERATYCTLRQFNIYLVVLDVVNGLNVQVRGQAFHLYYTLSSY